MRLFKSLAAALAVLLAVPTPAASESIYQKLGYWAVEAQEGRCMGSMQVEGGHLLMLVADQDGLSFGAGTAKAMRQGKRAELRTEAYSFEFEPVYGRESDVVYPKDRLSARAIAALRLADHMGVFVDGKPVFTATLKGTGFEETLDALIACASGQKGWWDEPAPKTAQTGRPELAMNKEGIWSLAADGDTCASGARIDESGGLVLIALNGGRDIVMGFGHDAGFKRGRKGVFATDAYSFAFKPLYEGDDYMQLDEVFDSQGLFALRRAKSLRVTIDGREVVSAQVADTGLDELLTSLADCGAGKSGWWGEGAKQP